MNDVDVRSRSDFIFFYMDWYSNTIILVIYSFSAEINNLLRYCICQVFNVCVVLSWWIYFFLVFKFFFFLHFLLFLLCLFFHILISVSGCFSYCAFLMILDICEDKPSFFPSKLASIFFLNPLFLHFELGIEFCQVLLKRNSAGVLFRIAWNLSEILVKIGAFILLSLTVLLFISFMSLNNNFLFKSEAHLLLGFLFLGHVKTLIWNFI